MVPVCFPPLLSQLLPVPYTTPCPTHTNHVVSGYTHRPWTKITDTLPRVVASVSWASRVLRYVADAIYCAKDEGCVGKKQRNNVSLLARFSQTHRVCRQR